GLTLFMTLLATFEVLLCRYSGQQDLLVGTPIAGRDRAEIEGLIGFFAGTLVLRGDLRGNPRGCELLRRVRETALDAYAHQDLPFERLVEELQPQRDLSRTPLFQVMFALQHAPPEPAALPRLTLEQLDMDRSTARFDLLLSLVESGRELSGTLEYSSDLFDPTTVKRLLGHYRTLLASMVADPEGRIWELALMPSSERAQLVVEWNATRLPYAESSCLHQLVRAQVERTPDDEALVDGERRLSYRELDAGASRLAHHLRGLGVGPEALVGISMERGWELVVAILGVLKAGGAYVPLDPVYPAERIAFMLEDAQAPVVLTQDRLVSRLPEHRARVVRLDADWETIASEPGFDPPDGAGTGNPPFVPLRGNLAYVIYTSGSTGRAKGVAIEHREAVAMVSWARGEFSD
ncbi:MAG: AMP-binding protein, partial [bacterium]|nr:AMP-binding protein [bacterium]